MLEASSKKCCTLGLSLSTPHYPLPPPLTILYPHPSLSSTPTPHYLLPPPLTILYSDY